MSHLQSIPQSADNNELSAVSSNHNPQGPLVRVAAWIDSHNLPFYVTSIGMIVMLLWAGRFKMTALGAQSITPLVTHSPLIGWQFRVFGPYVGSDMIGLTEITAALLYIVGYFKAQAGIVGGLITTFMFFITSSMLITTPGAVISYHGMRYMSLVGLFLYKDIIALGASLYLITLFRRRADG